MSKALVAGYKSQRKRSYERGGHCFRFEKREEDCFVLGSFFCLKRRETRAVRGEAIFVLKEKEKRGSVPFS